MCEQQRPEYEFISKCVLTLCPNFCVCHRDPNMARESDYTVFHSINISNLKMDAFGYIVTDTVLLRFKYIKACMRSCLPVLDLSGVANIYHMPSQIIIQSKRILENKISKEKMFWETHFSADYYKYARDGSVWTRSEYRCSQFLFGSKHLNLKGSKRE